MYMLIVFLPFLSALFILLGGKYFGKNGSIIFSVGNLFICLLLSFFFFFEIGLSGYVCIINLYNWIDLGFFSINIGFLFDTVTVVMIFVVCSISFFVHLYSIEYMAHDPGFNRFMSYLSLFTFFMLFLVTSNNFVQMFLGWEGVGLASYLLISFWYTRILANKAAIKAMLVNKIGDLALLIGICLIVYLFGSLNYIIVFNLVDFLYNQNINILFFNFNILVLICFFLFLGAMGKSAQIGLHVWLPDAMEGPTPVSALIHAATMVTAGVFLVIRSSILFEYCQTILIFIGFIGGLTCLFSAIIGCFQFDIKRIVAYSTCSQLGYMFFSCGLSNYNLSLFHLFNHAFFKALLFLSMGSILHALSDEQDLRKMGGLVKLLPFSYVMVMIGSVALMGIPFFTGYYSKDFLLEFTFSMYSIHSVYIYMFGVFAAFFTTFYSLRLIYWVFFSTLNFNKNRLYLIHEPSIYMTLSLLVLSICSIFIGYLFFELFIGMGSNFFNNSIYINYLNETTLNSEFSLFIMKYVPLFLTIMSIVFFYMYIFFYQKIYFYFFENILFSNFYKLFNKAFYFDIIYNDLFFIKFLELSYFKMYKYVEKGFLSYFLINFVKICLLNVYNIFNKVYSGLIYDYIFLILVSIIYFCVFFFCILLLDVPGFIILFFGMYYFFIINKINEKSIK